MEIFRTLKNKDRCAVFLGMTILLFDINYLIIKNLPSSAKNMCVEGGSITTENLLFSLLTAILTSLLIINFVRAIKEKTQWKRAVAGTGISGTILGLIAVFCAACALPAISILGISFSTTFLIDKAPILKTLSIILLMLGLYLTENQLRKNCKFCA